ncbi:MAG: OmpA family protein [Rhodospirillales bacterium]|nr:OmpA family protein [Rhodospirillales bacterium]
MKFRRPQPTWMVTYADLMALLLCLFVLILSFSDINQDSFRKNAGPLSNAFGVRRDHIEMPAPSANTIILRPSENVPKVEMEQAEIVMMVKETLADELSKNIVEVAEGDGTVTMRFPGSTAFSSGSADLQPSFYTTLDKVVDAIADTKGGVSVSGHTDDVPINTERFRSNWDLSSARAVSVAHYLLDSGRIDSKRMTVSGHADSIPVKPNDSSENRAVNRRVEITINVPRDEEEEEEALPSLLVPTD